MSAPQIGSGLRSAVGIGYRAAIDTWTRANLDRFDVREITVDHCIHGGGERSAIFDLVGRIPLTAHGVGFRSAPMRRSTSPIRIKRLQSRRAPQGARL
jgi:hypothetical protein